tara:strand:- start:97 stop:324 length:228 start_codon:yes stop_codon:yes gene_type:complete
MWYNFFKKGEKMSNTGATKASVTRVENDVAQVQDVVSTLQVRMSAMRDEIELLTRDLNRLKETVAEDIKYLYERT